jgi:transposase
MTMAWRVIDGEAPDVQATAVRMVGVLSRQALDTHAQLREIDRAMATLQRTDDVARRLATIPGIGPVAATALAASVTDPGQFRSGRQFAAGLGLTPLQNSSGGKERLGRISNMGDRYLRKLLVIGATSLVRRARQATDVVGRRPADLLARKPVRLATVAMANKIARIVWAVLTRGEIYRKAYVPVLAT